MDLQTLSAPIFPLLGCAGLISVDGVGGQLADGETLVVPEGKLIDGRPNGMEGRIGERGLSGDTAGDGRPQATGWTIGYRAGGRRGGLHRGQDRNRGGATKFCCRARRGPNRVHRFDM